MTSSFVGNTQALQAQVAAPRTGHVRESITFLARTRRFQRVLLLIQQQGHGDYGNDAVAGQGCHGHA